MDRDVTPDPDKLRAIAHELNNQMSTILGCAELVLEVLPPNHPARIDVEEILGAGKRASKQTGELGALARMLLQP